jgi:hypothetical protein
LRDRRGATSAGDALLKPATCTVCGRKVTEAKSLPVLGGLDRICFACDRKIERPKKPPRAPLGPIVQYPQITRVYPEDGDGS